MHLYNIHCVNKLKTLYSTAKWTHYWSNFGMDFTNFLQNIRFIYVMNHNKMLCRSLHFSVATPVIVLYLVFALHVSFSLLNSIDFTIPCYYVGVRFSFFRNNTKPSILASVLKVFKLWKCQYDHVNVIQKWLCWIFCYHDIICRTSFIISPKPKFFRCQKMFSRLEVTLPKAKERFLILFAILATMVSYCSIIVSQCELSCQ